MFECCACLVRGFRVIAAETLGAQPVAHPRRRLLLTPHLGRAPIHRTASTAAAARDVEPDVSPPQTQSGAGDALEQADARNTNRLAAKDSKALRTELKYLGDPLKLAEHVRYTLRCNKPEKALNLCRLASKQQEVIVSWNHCVDWHMSVGMVDEAVRIYNEMKKRAQFPDSYTYLLLLRGLAKSHHRGQLVNRANVIKALSIYTSMTIPTSRVKPSIFHTNATLKVCSAALDMDALWSVAARLPASGYGAPDRVTYAILLTAIRHGAVGNDPRGTNLGQLAARRQEAVNQGRRIWQEIVPKWRAGEIAIDEELVCAMGRLLMISKRMQDWDDVLSLVQQTMNIERQIPAIGSAKRQTGHVPQEIQAPGSAEESPEDAEGYRDAPSTKAFYPVVPLPPDSAHPKRPSTLAYVHPTNTTLSMLIGTCTLLRTPKTANAYWDLITGPLGIQADLQNYHAQFRLLGVSRASAKAVQVLKKMTENGLKPEIRQTFRIVMSVCMRDKNNHNSLEHAGEVVGEMEKQGAGLDAYTLTQYLNLALSTDDGTKIVSALERLEPLVEKLRSSMTRESRDRHVAHVQSSDDIVALCQCFVSAIDTLVSRGQIPLEDSVRWQTRRTELTQLIGAAKNSHTPGLRQVSERDSPSQSRGNEVTSKAVSETEKVTRTKERGRWVVPGTEKGRENRGKGVRETRSVRQVKKRADDGAAVGT